MSGIVVDVVARRNTVGNPGGLLYRDVDEWSSSADVLSSPLSSYLPLDSRFHLHYIYLIFLAPFKVCFCTFVGR